MLTGDFIAPYLLSSLDKALSIMSRKRKGPYRKQE